jgi:hypothetical protein
MTKRHGFSGSFKRGADNLLDEIIDTLEQFPVRLSLVCPRCPLCFTEAVATFSFVPTITLSFGASAA